MAILVFTVLLGLAYPLATTGIAQVLFPNKADGSQIERDGKVVGSRLIGQDFKGRPRYFQSRPSVTDYNPAATFFNNLGPNTKDLRALFEKNLAAYLEARAALQPGPREGRRPARRRADLGVRAWIRTSPRPTRGSRPGASPRSAGSSSTACSSWSTRTPTAAASACSASPA